jgi:DNA-binding NarL/FixJ family response regulator
MHLRIVNHLAAGATDGAIAEAELLSQRTVRRRVHELMKQCGVASRPALVAVAAWRGWLEPPRLIP